MPDPSQDRTIYLVTTTLHEISYDSLKGNFDDAMSKFEESRPKPDACFTTIIEPDATLSAWSTIFDGLATRIHRQISRFQ